MFLDSHHLNIISRIFQSGVDLFCFLMGDSGLGDLIGDIYLINRKCDLGLGKLIIISTITFTLGLIGFAYSHIVLISVLFIFFTGLGMMIELVGSNTLLQIIVDDNKRAV